MWENSSGGGGYDSTDFCKTFHVNDYLLMSLYVPVFMLALTANTLVIVIVIKYQFMRSVTNYFLVNLSVADLLVTLVCMPKAVWRAHSMLWYFGETTCKLTSYLQCVAVAASVFTITMMAIDRYLAITRPFGFVRWFTRKTTIVVIAALWILALTTFAPMLWVVELHPESFPDVNGTVITYARNITINFCEENWPLPEQRQVFGIITYIIIYVIPGLLMLIAYSLMGRRLCSVRPPFDNNEGFASTQQSFRLVRERKRVAWILLLLALVFAGCWLPYNTINLLKDTHSNGPTNAVMESYALLLGHANSALNPIIYCVMSKNFRKSFKEVLLRTRDTLMFNDKKNAQMHWMDSSVQSSQRLQRMKMVPVITNKRRHLTAQSSQKTTKTCAV